MGEPDIRNAFQQLQVNRRELHVLFEFALFCLSHFGIFLCASAILNVVEMRLMHTDCQNKVHHVSAEGLQIHWYQQKTLSKWLPGRGKLWSYWLPLDWSWVFEGKKILQLFVVFLFLKTFRPPYLSYLVTTIVYVPAFTSILLFWVKNT